MQVGLRTKTVSPVLVVDTSAPLQGLVICPTYVQGMVHVYVADLDRLLTCLRLLFELILLLSHQGTISLTLL